MGRIGITYNYWAPNWMDSLEEYLSRIPRAAAIGFDLMSFSQDIPLLFSKDQQQQVLDTAEKHGIKLNYMGGLRPGLDFNSDSEEERRAAVEHLQNLAEKLGQMQEGAELAGSLTGVLRQGLGKRDKQVCWDHTVRGMKEAIKAAEDHGVTFSIEVLNRFEHFLINTCEEALRFIEEVGSPNLKMLLDTYHMNIEEDSLGEAIVKAGDHLGLFHIGENNRKPPGRGHIPWAEVVSALKEIDYSGDTVMEPIVHPGGDVGPTLAVWRDLTDGRDLDEAAREGLEFYRQKLAEA
jgi:D-psicose/D-tagatose/L-ribulose 3-epimerase